jgi:large subunit ribosomal protein L29
MTSEELVKLVKELKEEMFVLKFQQATGKTEGAAKRRTLRKDIARIYTVLTEREGK